MDPVEQVRQKANLIEIASQYTTLTRKGRKAVGLCPFHTEKTPSFTIDEDKQLYHCFGCGAGGDIFTFVMEKENFEFPEALRFLAERYDIRLPDQRKMAPGERNEREQVYQLSEEALAYFRRNLHKSDEGGQAMAYLNKRGISEETIRQLRLGYASNAWDGLLNDFRRRNVPATLLEKAGLVLRRQRGDGFYDRFRGRIIFPIFSLSNKVLAFGGRTIFDDDPKYLNSPDTSIYTKGNVLYGLNTTRPAIRDKGELILVEGYTDFLALFQAGIHNTAASLGTSVTTEQMGLALKNAPRVVVCYDSDTAGRRAAARAVHMGLEKDLQIEVMLLPAGHDPDSYIKEKGADAFSSLARKSQPGLHFLIESKIPNKGDLTARLKIQVAREILQYLENVSDSLLKNEYVKQIAEYLKIDEGEIRSVMKFKRGTESAAVGTGLQHVEKRLIQVIFEDSGLAKTIFDQIEEEDFIGLTSEPIFQALFLFFSKGAYPDLNKIRERIEPEQFKLFVKILNEESEQKPTLKEADELVQTLKQNSLGRRRKKLEFSIREFEKKGEVDKVFKIQKELMDIDKHLYELSQRIY